MIGNYKPNSHKSKQEERTAQADTRKKVDKVVSGPVKTRKNEIRKMADVFISKDARDVKSYIFWDILVPAIKDAVEDIVTNGIRMILRGDEGPRRTNSRTSPVSYTKFYESRDDDRRRDSDYQRNRYCSYDDFVFESRGEAEAVLSRMEDLIEQYQMVSVGDLYDLVGKSGPYTSNNYGWTNLRNAEVKRVRDGYWLDLPRALPLS